MTAFLAFDTADAAAVRAVIEDEPVKNLVALENPDALEQYRSLEALRT